MGDDSTVRHAELTTPDCHVVVGPDAVLSLRSSSPNLPIVALVDASSPIQAILAQAAGADIVLPTSELEVGAHHDTPGLALAISAATTLAHRRSEVARTSQQVSHDLSESLNVIGLAAEMGGTGAVDPADALAQVGTLARQAAADGWRVGRAYRSLRRSITAVEVNQLVRRSVAPADDITIRVTDDEAWAFADDWQLGSAVAELVTNARRSGAHRIDLEVRFDHERRVLDVIVADDGPGLDRSQIERTGEPFNTPPSTRRLGLGLATIHELATDLGGTLELTNGRPGGSGVTARLSLPALDGRSGVFAARTALVDQATAQAKILEGVVRHAPLAESLEAIVAAIEHQLPDTSCSILLLRDGHTLHHGGGARLPAAYRDAIDGVEIGRGQGSCGTAAYVGHPIIATDVTTDDNWVDFRDLAMAHGLRSCWSTPIVAAAGGEVLGTFAVYKSTVWGPDQAAIRLVERFTYLAAVAIGHHRLFGALAESESRFRGAFEGATAGMALVGLDGAMLKVNPALSIMLGADEIELLSTNLLDLIEPTHRGQVTSAWNQLIATGHDALIAQPSIEVPMALRHRDQPLWVSLSSSIITAESGGDRYFYIEARDISADRRHASEQRAREAAEAANLAKNDFLALVSHELRTPLNAILGFAQVMQMVDLGAEQRADSVEQIVRSGQHLRDLIDELLDLSRIEAGQLSVTFEQISTNEVVSEALDIVRPLATSREITLVADLGGADPVDMYADQRCVRQVLINLLGNAVKYTPEGGRVEVGIGRRGDRWVRVSISDTGPGIAAESLDELFQPFHRLDPHSLPEPEGTGLGLAVAARLMEELGGSIGVESTLGVGSCFWVDFPLSGPTEEPPAAPVGSGDPSTSTPAGPPLAANGVLLYVEDDPACVAVITAALALRPGVDLRTAATAADGIAGVQSGGVDAVLLDIGLPDRSGWELLTELRRDRPGLPVVVLTAGPDEVPAGVPTPDFVFTKPLDLSESLRAIDLVLAGSARDDRAAELVDLGDERR